MNKIDIKLKLYEVDLLQSELLGLKNPETGKLLSEGILNEKLNLVTKYWLNFLSNELNTHLNSVEKLRKELFEKYGESKDETYVIEPVIDGKPNPKFEEYLTSFNQLMETEVEINAPVFKLEDFESVNSKINIKILSKLIKIDD